MCLASVAGEATAKKGLPNVWGLQRPRLLPRGSGLGG